MRRSVALLALLPLLVGPALPAAATAEATSRRLAGPDRYATAAAVALTDRPTAGTAVLARGDDPADALSGSTLAGALDGPLLLTPRDRLAPAAADALGRLGVTRVVLLGGPSAVSEAVAADLRGRGLQVDRLAGTDRFDTARLVAAACGAACRAPSLDGLRTALLGGVTATADAAAAAPLAADGPLPLLLTARDALPPATEQALEDGDVQQVVVVGGEAVVGPGVVAQLRAAGRTVRRVAGGDRQGTSAALARLARDELDWPLTSVLLARGDDVADALAGGPLGGRAQAPLLLTAGTALGAAARDVLVEARATLTRVDVLGGPAAVPDRVAADAVRAAGGTVAGCGDGSAPGTPSTVTRGLTLPWGLAVLPDGSALVSERDTARLRVVRPDGRVTELGTVPGVVPGGEGGLLGVAVSPEFATDRWVYAYLTAGSENKVVRMPYEQVGTAVQTLLGGIPKANIHNGGRIAFGPDGMLYVGTGDAGNTALSQDRRSLGGKVLRLRPDGGVPADNPFAGSPVFSLGHRNVQGLGFDEAGRLWASELGQNTFDEVNLLRAGGNYGWPVVEGRGDDPRFVDPVVTWAPSESSPSGAVVAEGSLWVAALRGQRLWQVALDGATVGAVTPHFAGQYGRLRAVAQTASCDLLVLTNESDGRLLRVPLS